MQSWWVLIVTLVSTNNFTLDAVNFTCIFGMTTSNEATLRFAGPPFLAISTALIGSQNDVLTIICALIRAWHQDAQL